MAVSTESVAGVVAGRNPLAYSASSPYTVFLFQCVLIMFFCHVLHWPLQKIRQPRVIAEVLAGIVLGPTVMGRIPGFTATCFSAGSKVGLTLVANIGIILFLFIVGLEVDLRYVRKNARVALSVGFINMAIPFALGCGIARGLYNEYHTDSTSQISFTTYMVFIAVALCITAFPVLARILVELNLIGDSVGTVVLSAGILNDLVGWILLALVVTLANADNGLHTLYILLLTLAWFLLLVYPVRMALKWYLHHRTGELATGQPSQLSMVLIIAMVFTSAFYTDIIGVHPIFGAFMVGVIVPRDNGYVIRITEKLEDLVHLVMIPIYFALAGLNVDLGQLDRGIDWAYVVGVIGLAMAGKIFGGYAAATLNGFIWRDSLAVGVLMSCKGIVEIVVLNVGLNAKIISARVYSIFILMALVTTFLTTPLALWVYPARARAQPDRLSPADKEKNALMREATAVLAHDTLDQFAFSSVVLLLRKLEGLPSLLLLFRDLEAATGMRDTPAKAIHLRDFTSRTSHLLEASAAGEAEASRNDREHADSLSLLALMEAFGSLLRTRVATVSLLVPTQNHVAALHDHLGGASDLLLTALAIPSVVQTASLGPGSDADMSDAAATYTRLFAECTCHVGVLLAADGHGHVGGSTRVLSIVLDHDDRLSASDLLALHFVRSLARKNSTIRVYVRSAAGYNKQFASQFDEYLAGSASGVEVAVLYFKELSDIFVEGQVLKSDFEADVDADAYSEDEPRSLFVVTHEMMEGSALAEGAGNTEGDRENGGNSALMRFAMRDNFDILVVRATG